MGGRVRKIKNSHESLIFGPHLDIEKCQGIHEYFEKQVRKNPKAIALRFESQTLTYADLNSKANQVAHFLINHKIRPNDFVGILMDRSFEMYISILGILKAGGAYAPLDPELPVVRLGFLVEDLKLKVILTQSLHVNLISKENKKIKMTALDDEWNEIFSQLPTKNLKTRNIISDLAYIIYTSGSTGKPKGCGITHKGLATLLEWTKKQFKPAQNKTVLQKAPLNFDFSVLEIFIPLICGNALVIAKPGGHRDFKYLIKIIQKYSLTTVMFVPSVLKVFLQEEGVNDCSSLKEIVAGGEALSPDIINLAFEHFPKIKLTNLYGPTETTVCVTYWECTPISDKTFPPIGAPLPNTAIYILDENFNPTPLGEYGEIYIGGDQIGKGYWNRPDLTSEKFLKDPFSKERNSVMYRTGDRGRARHDGAIEYQGRIDFQVKIKGLRIELGEIESQIKDYKGISHVAVVAKNLYGDESLLKIVAYFTTLHGLKIKSHDLRNYLDLHLPQYMVPSLFVQLSSLPITATEKIDRKALIDRQEIMQKEIVQDIDKPATQIEIILTKIWETALGLKQIGKNQNFFELGGDSLAVLRIIHLAKKSNIHLQYEDFRTHQTISSFAKTLKKNRNVTKEYDISLPPIKRATAPKGNMFPLALQQKVFWNSGAAEGKNSLISIVNKLSGKLEIDTLKECIKEITERHISLRTKFILKNGEVYQSPQKALKVFFQTKNLIAKSKEAAVSALQKALTEHIDIFEGPPYRCTLLNTGVNEYYLVFRLEHIVSDGESLNILKKEIQELYKAKILNKKTVLPEISVQYTDYALWQTKDLPNSTGFQSRINFWKRYLSNPPESSKIQSPIQGAGSVKSVKIELSDKFVGKIIDFSKKKGVTPYVTFLTAFSRAIGEILNEEEVLVLTHVALRPPEVENSMGCFVNSLPIKISVKDDISTSQMLADVNEQSFAVIANEVPLRAIHQLLEKEKNKYKLKQFQYGVYFTIGDRDPLDLPGIKSENIEIEDSLKVFGILNLKASLSSKNSVFNLVFNSKALSEKKAHSIAKEFVAIVKHLIQQSV